MPKFLFDDYPTDPPNPKDPKKEAVLLNKVRRSVDSGGAISVQSVRSVSFIESEVFAV